MLSATHSTGEKSSLSQADVSLSHFPPRLSYFAYYQQLSQPILLLTNNSVTIKQLFVQNSHGDIFILERDLSFTLPNIYMGLWVICSIYNFCQITFYTYYHPVFISFLAFTFVISSCYP